ncbi:hypothetical protein [Rufibacter quisquiliarum]|uniref:Uncharacterized protein n=1 Tax=Rufibacter quisquiliarum TaxID=1549639 RepID=A0A839GWN6_9BACT|nr:hypothetical protein [Rufibacter quisquiliarum]MBA9079865.1 hypothetical protein [Rufibacter quisquiliarum]
MKIFPTNNYTVELNDDSSLALDNLKQNTKLTDSLVSELTQKAFIGQVQESRFKVISSAPGYGALCVLTGDFQGKEGIINIKIHTAFKVLSLVLMILPIILVGVTLATKEIEYPIGFIVPISMTIIFVRFGLLGLGFRTVSNNSMNRLREVIKMREIKNVA